MQVEPLEGFQSLETHHCVTGSMLQIFRYHGVDVSEDMLLGLGAGAGFFYWHMKGAAPMLLGRGNVHRPKVEGLEIDACRRLGIGVQRFTTGSSKKAHASLLGELQEGRPVMAQVDMGFLPYFDFEEEYHFGGHVIVVAGCEDDSVVVADRDAALHSISVQSLQDARGSTFKPFPPKHMWYRYDCSRARAPTKRDLREAIAQNARGMLEGPISNLGVRGIRKAARLIPRWKDGLDAETLRWACINNFIFIDATGGTGGGMFRLMYGRFLHEVREITGDAVLGKWGDLAKEIGHQWDGVAQTFQGVAEAKAEPAALVDLGTPMSAIADREEELWTGLRSWAEA